MHTLSYSYSGSKDRINLNSNLSDMDINYAAHAVGYQVTLLAGLTFEGNYARTALNEDEVLMQQYAAGVYFRVGAMQFGISGSQAKTLQLKDVVVLSRNFKDEMKFIQNAVNYYADVQWSDRFLTALRSTYYSYDENLDNYNALLTTQVFLQQGSGAFASEVQAQLRNSVELSLVYLWGDKWLFEVAAGTSQESLSPSDSFNEASVGVEYEISGEATTYKLSYGISVTKNRSGEDGDVTTAHLVSLGARF